MVRSRLQKQVLSLYRKFLRASQDKPGFTDYIKHEFRKNSVISKTDGLRIEYLLRRAQNQLKQLEKMETKSMGFFTQEAASDKSWIFGTCFWFVNYVTFEKWSKRNFKRWEEDPKKMYFENWWVAAKVEVWNDIHLFFILGKINNNNNNLKNLFVSDQENVFKISCLID